MRTILILFLFTPLFSYSQSEVQQSKELRFSISEMAGESFVINRNSLLSNSNEYYRYNNFNQGFSNHISLNYHFSKCFSLGAIYVFNNWSAENNLFGLTTNFYFNIFYFGADVIEANVNPQVSKFYAVNFDPSPSLELHAGFRQKINKHLHIKEQIGISRISLHNTLSFSSNLYPYYPLHSYEITDNVDYAYFVIGLSYQL